MNCEQHAALLEKLWEDAITPEEEARLREHEERCDDCARRRREAELLRMDLDALAQEELPLPEGFHQGWMQLVEQEVADMHAVSQAPKRQRKSVARLLSLAAAVVFLVGGTLLTRDQLQLTQPSTVKSQVTESGTAMAVGMVAAAAVAIIALLVIKKNAGKKSAVN